MIGSVASRKTQLAMRRSLPTLATLVVLAALSPTLAGQTGATPVPKRPKIGLVLGGVVGVSASNT